MVRSIAERNSVDVRSISSFVACLDRLFFLLLWLSHIFRSKLLFFDAWLPFFLHNHTHLTAWRHSRPPKRLTWFVSTPLWLPKPHQLFWDGLSTRTRSVNNSYGPNNSCSSNNRRRQRRARLVTTTRDPPVREPWIVGLDRRQEPMITHTTRPTMDQRSSILPHETGSSRLRLTRLLQAPNRRPCFGIGPGGAVPEGIDKKRD